VREKRAEKEKHLVTKDEGGRDERGENDGGGSGPSLTVIREQFTLCWVKRTVPRKEGAKEGVPYIVVERGKGEKNRLSKPGGEKKPAA